MTSLPVFLLARLDEDEAAARRVSDPISGRDDLWTFDGPFDPARVLADVEAKRRIVEQAVGIAEVGRMTGVEDPGGERILRLLALPYADHPDYRAEWKP